MCILFVCVFLLPTKSQPIFEREIGRARWELSSSLLYNSALYQYGFMWPEWVEISSWFIYVNGLYFFRLLCVKRNCIFVFVGVRPGDTPLGHTSGVSRVRLRSAKERNVCVCVFPCACVENNLSFSTLDPIDEYALSHSTLDPIDE